MTRSANLTGILDSLLPETLPPGNSKGQQVRVLLNDLVRQLGPGALFPSEQVLADRYGLAKMTVRQQMEALVRDGRLTRIPGRGTLVSEPRLMQLEFMSSFSKEMEARGFAPGGKVVSCQILPADREIAACLRVKPGEPILRIDRLRTANGEPMAFERNHLVSRRFPGLESLIIDDVSLRELMRSYYACQPEYSEQTISATSLDAADARLLGVPANAPALMLRGGTFDSDRRPIDFGWGVYRADRFELVMRTGNHPRTS